MHELHDVLKQLKGKEWVDLTHNVYPEMPRFSMFDPIDEEVLFTKEEAGFFVKKYTFTGQYGTHIDAPVHFSQEYLRDITEIELKELWAPLYVLRLENRVAQNDDYSVSVDDILEFEKEYEKIPEGAFVAFCSNWSKRWENPDEFYNFDKEGKPHTPGWSEEAVKFLAHERKVVAIGHENLDTDASMEAAAKGFFFAEKAILDANCYQIEVMKNLDKVPPVGAIIISLVPKIDKSPGFPIRSMAILPE